MDEAHSTANNMVLATVPAKKEAAAQGAAVPGNMLTIEMHSLSLSSRRSATKRAISTAFFKTKFDERQTLAAILSNDTDWQRKRLKV